MRLTSRIIKYIQETKYNIGFIDDDRVRKRGGGNEPAVLTAGAGFSGFPPDMSNNSQILR